MTGGDAGPGLPAMDPAEVVRRLAALPHLEGIPRRELEWLVGHGRVELYEAGSVIAPKGKRIEDPAQWTEARIRERAAGFGAKKGGAGNFDD